MAKAREAGVEVVRDADLIELLAKIPVGQQIPPELYQAVAEILAFVYRVNGKMGDRR
jgi:flagellar biosynthesis protein